MRRISETLTTPLVSVGGGPIGGGGGGGGGSGETQTVTDREYVWAPPPSGYVDECVAQIDRTNAVRYVIQDASYDVVALVTPQTSGGNPQPSKVIAQYTWDPYGQVLTAEYAGLASTYNKLGHHGLFADRLDAGYQSATLMVGFVASTHLPARIVYNVRNRTYEPSTQRWLQRDPNATGQVVLGSLASGGQRIPAATAPIEPATLYGDGTNLFQYLRSSTMTGADPLGLEFSMIGILIVQGASDYLDAAGTLDEVKQGIGTFLNLNEMIDGYALLQADDMEWALDWSRPDDYLGLLEAPDQGLDEYASGGDAFGLATIFKGPGAKSAARKARKSAKLERFYDRVARVSQRRVPPEARKELAYIQAHNGSPSRGVTGGTPWRNEQSRLPQGVYREYDIRPHGGGNRGRERILIDQQTGKAYYTDDHYGRFLPMN